MVCLFPIRDIFRAQKKTRTKMLCYCSAYQTIAAFVSTKFITTVIYLSFYCVLLRIAWCVYFARSYIYAYALCHKVDSNVYNSTSTFAFISNFETVTNSNEHTLVRILVLVAKNFQN